MFKRILEFYGTIGVPLLYLLGLYLIVYGAKMVIPLELQVGGLVAGIVGIIVWVVSYVNLGASFGVLPRKQVRVTRGIYKYIKHPMYKGIMLTFFGLSLANSSYTGAWYCLLVLFPLLFVRARIEDKNLS